jgi:tetratricopeptide (TPR) repeat protein
MKRALSGIALLAVLASCTAQGAATPAPAAYSHELSEKLYRQGKYSDDEALCKQAIADIEKSKGAKAWTLAEPLNDLATVYMRQARYAEAKQVIDRADSVLDKTKPDQVLIYARLGINKGWRLYTFGETTAATKVFEEAQALLEKNQKGESIDLAELINNVGLMYEDSGQKDEDEDKIHDARVCLLKGWEMRRRLTGGDNSPESAESINNLGMHLLFNATSEEDADLALPIIKKSLDVAIKVYGENHPETAVSHATLGLALFMHDKPEDAQKEIMIAIPMTQRFLGDKHPDLAYELTTLGHILESQSHFEDAEKKFQEALAINEDTFGKTHPNIIPALEALKTLYDAKGDPAKSEEMERRIEKLQGKDI